MKIGGVFVLRGFGIMEGMETISRKYTVHVTSQKKAKNANLFLDNFLNKIVCGDAVDVMRQIPDGSVDLVVTSPPYNLKNSTGNGMKDGRGGKWADAALQKAYTHHKLV